MKALFQIEFRRAIANKKFAAVLAIEAALILYEFITYGLRTHNITIPFLLAHADSGKVDNIPGVYATWVGLHYGQVRTIFYAVLPLLTAFAYGSSLFEDEKTTHYHYNLITRANKRQYYTAKLAVLLLSGGTIAVFPFILSLLVNALLFPFEEVVACLRYFMGDAYVFSDLFYRYPLFYVFLYILYVFIAFGLFNGVCFITAYIFSNRYMVLAAPFCLYFCSFVVSNFIQGFISPWEYFRFNDVLKADVLQISVQVLLDAGLLGAVFWNQIRRRTDVL